VESESLFKRLSLFDVLVVGLMGLGVVFLFVSFRGKVLGEKVEVEYISAEGDEVGGNKIMVDVGGAVEKPGVYELEEGSRLKDALVAAGGLAEWADREWIGRVLNMAEEVGDGEKIYIPEEKEEGEITVSAASDSSLVDINMASESELDELWGVGPARVSAIIENRPYGSIEELLEKKVLPKNVFEANKEKMSVY